MYVSSAHARREGAQEPNGGGVRACRAALSRSRPLPPLRALALSVSAPLSTLPRATEASSRNGWRVRYLQPPPGIPFLHPRKPWRKQTADVAAF